MHVTTTSEDGFSSPVESSDATVEVPPVSELQTHWLVPAATWAFIGLLALATGALVLKTSLYDAEAIRLIVPQSVMFAVVVALYAAALLMPISLHYRGNTYLFVQYAVPSVLGLVFLAPRLLVLAVIGTEAAIWLFARRRSLVRVTFNVVQGGLAVALACAVFRLLLGPYSPISFHGWVTASAALCCATVVGTMALWVVTTLNGQTLERRTGFEWMFQVMLAVAGICLALVVLNAAWLNVWAIVPVLLVEALVVVAYRNSSRLTLRFASLQRLYDSSEALGKASLEPISMSAEVLTQVCRIMRARRAQLVFAEPTGFPRRISLDEDRLSGVEPIILDRSSIVMEAIRTGRVLHRSSGSDAIVGVYRDAVAAPLMAEGTAIGAVVVLDRDEEQDTFDEDDLRVFEAFVVANAGANLERARLVEELRFEAESKAHQATHDSLTNLPNRTLFLSRTASAYSETDGVAIVLLGIDRFKDVNDTLGHAIGDLLLLEISERLSRVVPADVTVARLSGDEFAFVVPNVLVPERAMDFVQHLHSEMSRPFKMDGLTLAVTASAGIALAPAHGDDAALLLQRADIAMYVAKARHSSTEVYSVELDQSMHRRLMLGGLLTQALEQGDQLHLMYQPIADVATRQIVQVEALARWSHPEHGAIPPDEFIGIAEQMGLVSHITDFVLGEACAQLARWRKAGVSIGLAVNVSGREFADFGLVDRVARQLQAHDLSPELLTLEVTETDVMADFTQAIKVLDALAAMGIHIGIDDYGTGYSSLERLHRLPVQKLKIDRSFVTNLPTDMTMAIIVRSSIAMAHSLGLKVVAEGAEDEVSCAMLADAECDFIQGYHLSRPIAPNDLQEWFLGGASLEFTPLGSPTHPAPVPEVSRAVARRPRVSSRQAGADRRQAAFSSSASAVPRSHPVTSPR
jgi:diguanylate cyclase (GGDEF)-like protein